jgi:hypothetical protein
MPEIEVLSVVAVLDDLPEYGLVRLHHEPVNRAA